MRAENGLWRKICESLPYPIVGGNPETCLKAGNNPRACRTAGDLYH